MFLQSSAAVKSQQKVSVFNPEGRLQFHQNIEYLNFS